MSAEMTRLFAQVSSIAANVENLQEAIRTIRIESREDHQEFRRDIQEVGEKFDKRIDATNERINKHAQIFSGQNGERRMLKLLASLGFLGGGGSAAAMIIPHLF